MNSMRTAAQAAPVGAQPSTVSWSVSAMQASPWCWSCKTSSSGENVPSENFVCKCKSANFIRFNLPSRAHQFTFDLVEDAVHKLAAVLGGKLFGDVHRLVDAHDGRDVLAVEHLVDRQAHDVAVHRGDAVKIPVFGVFLDLF